MRTHGRLAGVVGIEPNIPLQFVHVHFVNIDPPLIGIEARQA
jgi:hypothetical protein